MNTNSATFQMGNWADEGLKHPVQFSWFEALDELAEKENLDDQPDAPSNEIGQNGWQFRLDKCPVTGRNACITHVPSGIFLRFRKLPACCVGYSVHSLDEFSADNWYHHPANMTEME